MASERWERAAAELTGELGGILDGVQRQLNRAERRRRLRGKQACPACGACIEPCGSRGSSIEERQAFDRRVLGIEADVELYRAGIL